MTISINLYTILGFIFKTLATVLIVSETVEVTAKAVLCEWPGHKTKTLTEIADRAWLVAKTCILITFVLFIVCAIVVLWTCV